MASIIKADNLQKVSDDSNIIKKCGSTITVGSSGATVSLASGASQTGFGTPSSSVLWCTTAKTSPFTAADKVGYFVNTTGGVITVTLPSSPSAGDVVAFKDYASTWQTNKVTICNNSSKINGVCATATLNSQGQSITLIYVDATKGWQDIQDSTANVTGAAYIVATGGTIVDCGNFRTHIFTGDGPFAVSALSQNAPDNNADYLVSGGGGSGGATHGGGGGAGGFRLSNSLALPAPSMSPLASGTGIPISIQNYTISVGAGGTAPVYPGPSSGYGTTGVLSTFATITSAGGGRGSTAAGANPLLNGGSGGGGTYSPNPGTPGGGTGNTPPVSPPQGTNGGNGGTYGPGAAAGGGGGGAGGTGTAGTPSNAGPGGVGSYISDAFIGPQAPSYGTPGPVSSTRYFSGGGGAGATVYGAPSTPTGGAGGGGDGQSLATTAPTSGDTNTGGGGGGGSGGSSGGTPDGTGGGGGSGVVMIRYRFQ